MPCAIMGPIKEEEPMFKKTSKSKKKSTADKLLKTSKKKDIELTEKELGKVSGGTPNKVAWKMG